VDDGGRQFKLQRKPTGDGFQWGVSRLAALPPEWADRLILHGARFSFGEEPPPGCLQFEEIGSGVGEIFTLNQVATVSSTWKIALLDTPPHSKDARNHSSNLHSSPLYAGRIKG